MPVDGLIFNDHVKFHKRLQDSSASVMKPFFGKKYFENSQMNQLYQLTTFSEPLKPQQFAK